MAPSATRFPQHAAEVEAASQWVSGIENNLTSAGSRTKAPLQFSRGKLETCLDANSFWLLYSFPTAGKLAFRTCFDPQTLQSYRCLQSDDTRAEFRVKGSLGDFRILVQILDPDKPLLHYTVFLKPSGDLLLQSLPPDLYVLDRQYNPLKTKGIVYVTQNGPTSGLAYFSLTEPKAGTVLYFQNLTTLNEFCEITQSDPSGTVGAQWPAIGLTLPAAQKPLPAHREICISDAYVSLNDEIPTDEFRCADLFVEAMAAVYSFLPKPKTDYFDWPELATSTIRTLSRSSVCGRRINGRFYLNAYVDSTEKPPESMVHFAVLVPLLEYQAWKKAPIALADRLLRSMETFFDESLGTAVRWLPGQEFTNDDPSEEEDVMLMDSWYLFHILLNLGRLAGMGYETARKMFFSSLDFALKTARHFEYEWPVFYHVKTLEVVKDDPKPGMHGEQDVPGLYTHIMLQAYELSQNPIYLQEAENSAKKLQGKGFDLLYQTNNTAMSAVALAKLWKATGNRLYFDLSRLLMTNVIAKMWIWECDFGYAKHYHTFMGISPLHDGEYVAAYEEAESFAVFSTYLRELGDDAPSSLRLLLAEYAKYLLHRGRYYYPSELPREAIAEQPKEGTIDLKLPIPLEDLRVGWQQMGQVGQEVYGSANAFIMASYAYLRLPRVPILVYCEYPVRHADFRNRGGKAGDLTILLAGVPSFLCRIRIFPKQKHLPKVQLFVESEETPQVCSPLIQTSAYYEFEVPGGQRLRIEWEAPSPKKKLNQH